MKLYKQEQGAINALLIPLIFSILFLMAAVGFGAWAFLERSEYKNNSDQKAAAAVAVAVERAKSEKDNEFIEKEKLPLKTYTGPLEFGGITLKYPKTWSAYSKSDSSQLTLLLNPDVVSSGENIAYALKVEVLDRQYSQVFSEHESNIKQGKTKAAAYTLPKVPSVVGLRLDGELGVNKNGAAVYLPLRDKTLKISTESQERVGDFNNIILPNFEFKP